METAVILAIGAMIGGLAVWLVMSSPEPAKRTIASMNAEEAARDENRRLSGLLDEIHTHASASNTGRLRIIADLASKAKQ